MSCHDPENCANPLLTPQFTKIFSKKAKRFGRSLKWFFRGIHVKVFCKKRHWKTFPPHLRQKWGKWHYGWTEEFFFFLNNQREKQNNLFKKQTDVILAGEDIRRITSRVITQKQLEIAKLPSWNITFFSGKTVVENHLFCRLPYFLSFSVWTSAFQVYKNPVHYLPI